MKSSFKAMNRLPELQSAASKTNIKKSIHNMNTSHLYFCVPSAPPAASDSSPNPAVSNQPRATASRPSAWTFLLSLLVGIFLLCVTGRNASAQTFPLFVTNSGNNTLESYTSAGAGTAFSTSNLSTPEDLIFDPAGDLYVANKGNGNIVKFTITAGVLSSTSTVFANVTGAFGLAMDSAGDLYVGSNTASTITKFTATAGVLSSTGATFASSPTAPKDITFDAAGDLLVVAGSGISKFAITAGVLSTSYSAFTTSGLLFAFGLAIDSAGNVYMSGNSDSGGILKYPSTGGASIGSEEADQYMDGMAIDSTGNLYYTASGGSPISKDAAVGGNPGLTSDSSFSATGVNSPQFMAFTPTPEPGSAVALAMGGAMLLARRRRR